jgi:hypothetical protein
MIAAPELSRFSDFVDRIAGLTGLPRATLVAAAAIVVGLVLAFVLRRLSERLVERIGRWLPGTEARESAAERRRARVVVGRVVFWTVMLVFVMSATEVLGLPVITTWLSGIASYLPRLLAAIVVLAIGVVAGRVARSAVTKASASAHIQYAARLGRIAQAAVVFATVLVAIEQLGLEVRFVTSALSIVLGAALGAAALAFGLGSRSVVENILSSHYVRKLYEVGHVVRIGDIEGRILKLLPTAVIIQTADGEVAIPAQEFARVRSTRLASGS